MRFWFAVTFVCSVLAVVLTAAFPTPIAIAIAIVTLMALFECRTRCMT
jgi:hypothetical protein